MGSTLLKNETYYNNALERVDIIFDVVPGTEEGNELERILLAINNYMKISITRFRCLNQFHP